MRNLKKVVTIIFLIVVGFRAEAQVASADEANDLFAKKRYSEAIPLYRSLLVRYPEDPTFNYRVGVAYYLSNENLNEAYKYLKISSTKEVPTMVYFYLGEVCRYLYRFGESLEYYKRFMQNGGSSEVPTVTVELAASASSNGQNLLKFGSRIVPEASAVVAASDFYKAYDTYEADAGFGPVPEGLLSAVDRKKKSTTLIFSRKSGGSVGDISVYASYGQGETGSLDLYYMEKQADGTWSRPRRLPSTINSPFDESYPYMCPDNKTLYFASKGLYSVGGYDIYRATYDKETQQWSNPENLGYPINSPYDDYLFVPGGDGSTACFASNRELKDAATVNVYRVSGINNALKQEFTPQMALDAQRLKPGAKNEAVKVTEDKAEQPEPAKTGVESLPAYRKLKVLLANNDMLLDSTVSKIERMRGAWEVLPDTSRKDIERLIFINEKQVRELNEVHNKLTDQAIAMEQDYLSGKLKNVPEAKPALDAWFVHDPKLQPLITAAQLDKLKQSPMTFTGAMSLADSLTALKEGQADLQQIAQAAQADERAKVGQQQATYSSRLKQLKNSLVLQWGWFYNSYYEVMSALAKAAAGGSGDTTLVRQSEASYLAAKGIRNGTELTGDTDKDYSQLEEAYLSEYKSLSLLNLYLAQKAEKKPLSDSLTAKLASLGAISKESSEKEQPASDFGTIKREEVVLGGVKFSSAPDASEFLIAESPTYSAQSPIPGLQSMPAGVTYSIQLGSFSQQLSYSLFRFSPMFMEQVGSGTTRKVYAGLFGRYQDVQQALPLVKANGFKDAFVVAFYDRKSTPVARARQLESKQGGVAPKVVVERSTSAMFRVVVGTYAGEMPANVKAIVEKYRGEKEIIKSAASDGSTTYSIGNFDNFEEAVPIKDKLISEGIVESFITKIDLNQIGQ